MLRRREQLVGRVARRWYALRQRSLARVLFAALRLWHALLRDAPPWPSPLAFARLWRRLSTLLARDLANVEAGYYPPSLLFRRLPHRLRRLPHSLLELARVWRCRRRRGLTELPPTLDLQPYPAYYRQAFHWQTDGWLSQRSARLYDAGVEFLFFGTADVMRRMVIPSLVDETCDQAAPRVLDIGCGTGRFLSQVALALPAARLSGVDLSPYYVDQARAQAPGLEVSWTVANAEALPFADASFDAVTSIFLFHELPAAAARQVVREAWRVLRPGGAFLVCDALQPPESLELAPFLEAFAGAYHEPYFAAYQRNDLGVQLAEGGFVDAAYDNFLLSRLVTARKPGLSPAD